MEKQLKCILLLSLKEIALRSVAVFLWNGSNILASISEFRLLGFSTVSREEEWRENIEDAIKDSILKLRLPKSLTKQMSDIVRPISLDVRRWKSTFQRYLYCMGNKYEIGLPDSAKLFFTTAGTINYQKTAEEIVRCNALDIKPRYNIACYYCLEYYIPLLWEDQSQEMKEHFYNKNLSSPYLEFCWPHILKGEDSKLDHLLRTSNRNLSTFNQWAFEFSAEIQCRTASEYFYKKLTREEKEASLMRAVHAMLASERVSVYPDEPFSDVFFYLLSLMTPEQQIEIAKAKPNVVFSCLFDWPWQDLLLENAGLLWSFLPSSGYGDLLERMKSTYSEFYSPKLFQDFFIQSPLDFKKCFVESASTFLLIFFISGDSESVQAIFRNIDDADRVKIVFNPNVLELFYECILEDRWHLLETCIREATLSRNDTERLKKEFLECNDSIRVYWDFLKLDRFFEILDETDSSSDEEMVSKKLKPENSSA